MNQNYEDKTANMNEKHTKSNNLTTEKDQIIIKVYCEEIPLEPIKNCPRTTRILEETYSFNL